MKSRNEIEKKINYWLDKLEDEKRFKNDCEYIFGIIDALLWVIGDESGKAI